MSFFFSFSLLFSLCSSFKMTPWNTGALLAFCVNQRRSSLFLFSLFFLLYSLIVQPQTIRFLFQTHFTVVHLQINHHFSSVQLLSCVQLFVTPWTAALKASLSITNSWSLHKLRSIESVMPSNHLTLCHSLFLPLSIFLSIRVFSKESVSRTDFV